MELSRKCQYALRALLELALQPDQTPTSVAELSAQGDIPRKFLEGILGELRQAGFVRSQRGPHGGFALDRPAEDITVAQVVTFIDGPVIVADSGKDSPFAEVWSQLRKAVMDVCAGTSLAEVARSYRRRLEQQHRVLNYCI
jgi:Rrf2 family protein